MERMSSRVRERPNVRDAVINAIASDAGYKAGHVFVTIGRRSAAIEETAFWQAAIASPALSTYFALNASSLFTVPAAEKILVPLNHEIGAAETALLLLDPRFQDEFRVFDARDVLKADDLAEGWMSHCRRVGSFSNAMPDMLERGMRGVLRNSSLPAFVLTARLPELELTQLPNAAVAVPTPAMGVSASLVAPVTATAGIYATNASGVFGVTAPYHALAATGSVAVGATVMIGSMAGVVQSADQISDSCFVSQPTGGARHGRATKGLLGTVTPRMNQPADFEGVTSGSVKTTILGWSPDLPFTHPFSQLKVYTSPDTNRGDSGAALLDSDGYLIGFAFYRTSLVGALQYSAWIWAESVYQAHGLK
jgi:hypothetical protein